MKRPALAPLPNRRAMRSFAARTITAGLSAEERSEGRQWGVAMLPESTIVKHERTALWLAAVGVIVVAACYAAAMVTPSRATAAEPMTIYAVDSTGNWFAAGKGDDCKAAAVEAIYPEDMVFAACTRTINEAVDLFKARGE